MLVPLSQLAAELDGPEQILHPCAANPRCLQRFCRRRVDRIVHDLQVECSRMTRREGMRIEISVFLLIVIFIALNVAGSRGVLEGKYLDTLLV